LSFIAGVPKVPFQQGPDLSYKSAMDANGETAPGTLGAQLRQATAFLTRLPMASRDRDDDWLDVAEAPTLADSMWLFPLVGFGIGGAGAIALGILAWAGVPTAVAAILAVGVMVWLTGALHEDGLSDVADGFGGGADKPSKLEIMRDSRLGAYGALTLAVVTVARIAAIAAIAAVDVGAAAGAMIAGATWSRALFAPTMRWLPPAREDGLGAGAGTPSEAGSWRGMGLAALLVLLVIATPAGWGTLVVLAAGALGAFAVGWIAQKQIDGYTGDVLGAAQQVAEAAALVAASAVIVGNTI
jgi:adenosylcobinamide-GDP ribazoletransferase